MKRMKLPGSKSERIGTLTAGPALTAIGAAALFASGCLVSEYRLYDGPPKPADQVAALEVWPKLVKKDEKLAVVCKIDSVPGTNTAGSVQGCKGVTPQDTCFNDTGASLGGLGFNAELSPGPHTLVVVPAETESPSPDTISFEAKPGRRYTVRIAVRWDEHSSWSLSGPTGKWRAEVVDIGEYKRQK